MKVYSKRQTDIKISEVYNNIERDLKKSCIESVQDQLRNMVRDKDTHDYDSMRQIIRDLSFKVDVLENEIIKNQFPKSSKNTKAKGKLNAAIKEEN